jgi:hypothetical protein
MRIQPFNQISQYQLFFHLIQDFVIETLVKLQRRIG